MRDAQQKSDSFESFLRRTDYLAQKRRCGVDDLAGVIGVSRASLYGYRKGQRNISNKAWAKLELAEKEAGIGQEELAEEPDGKSKKSPVVELLALLEHLPIERQSKIARIVAESQLQHWQDDLHVLWLDVGGAVSVMNKALEEMPEGEARNELAYFAKALNEQIDPARKIWNALFEIVRQLSDITTGEDGMTKKEE